MDPQCFGRRNVPPWRNTNGGLEQRLGGPSFKKGKGTAVNGDPPIGAASCTREQQIQGNPPPPPRPALFLDTFFGGFNFFPVVWPLC